MQPIITFNQITKIFPIGFLKKKLAVDNVSFSIPKGEVVGLVGANGSGKSTSIKMMLGFLKPNSGTIVVDGTDSKNKKIRSLIGYLPENPKFQKFLTGFEIMQYYANLLSIAKNEKKDRIEYLLNLVGLSKAQHEKVQGYSKGMTQRLAIAQSLLSNPPILVFDEPMSGLDPLGRREIRNLISNLHTTMKDKTIFFSSHILSDIENLCTSVVFLKKGKLKAIGAVKDLLNQNNLEEILFAEEETEAA
jgi:ABC-2 type transport system ATP-binding protein